MAYLSLRDKERPQYQGFGVRVNAKAFHKASRKLLL